jgi:hypothetical protein
VFSGAQRCGTGLRAVQEVHAARGAGQVRRGYGMQPGHEPLWRGDRKEVRVQRQQQEQGVPVDKGLGMSRAVLRAVWAVRQFA